MNSNTVIGINAISNLMPILMAGRKLSKKTNRTEEEEVALKSFKKSIRVTIWVTIGVVLLVSIPCINLIFSMPYGDKRYGTVEGDTVRYRMDTVMHTPIHDLGIDPSTVNEGDRILLLFRGPDDTFYEAIPVAELDRTQKRDLTILVVAFVVAVTGAVIGSRLLHKTIGKPFFDWFNKEISQGEKLHDQTQSRN